eukprot:CAMPEP_0171056486 /NCGR_PEP_ID=MMETSP0766_2-20121228/1043_1 /TAXON_ID=439317 /ORGANISM="Gambierdiscus australes, Strain CAWD 149" /LENGTH=170 /DNA_ID=CAMNT_0011511409 /DNA_START=143 /DNA_END=655 /DNA_ORIENTATION=+
MSLASRVAPKQLSQARALGEAPAEVVGTLLLQTDRVVEVSAKAARWLPGVASVPLKPGIALVSLQTVVSAVSGSGTQSLGRTDDEGGRASTSTEALLWAGQLKSKAWFVWPILLILLFCSCAGWLLCAISAQTGRCDNPVFNAMKTDGHGEESGTADQTSKGGKSSKGDM